MNTTNPERVNVPVESKLQRECVLRRRQVPKRLRLIQAEAALKSGSPMLAAELAEEILKEDSKHLGAMETLAKSLWRAGRFEQVVATTDRLLGLNPYEPGYHALKGAALQAMGRYGDAVECYDRSRDLPGSAEALRELQIWQAGLIGELMEQDPVFRASYAQDPQGACEAKGFRFTHAKPQEAFLPAQVDRVYSYNRPS